jgi:murein L,D-transpeptidase YcbB/YkuD
MSREQLADPQSQHATSGPEAGAQGDIQGLPPRLYAQVSQLRPGDVDGLRHLLNLHREMAPQILSAASYAGVGVSTIRQATAMAQHNTVVAQGAVSPSIGGADLIEDGPGASAKEEVQDYRSGGEFELDGGVAAPGAKPAAAEPTWVAGARKYNQAHATLVDEFNDLTNYKLAVDEGIVDPQTVARWQADHGLPADGKVGPHTLATARQVVAKAGPASAQADARIPV